MHQNTPYSTRSSIIELLFTQRKPQSQYVTLKSKNWLA